MALLWPWVGEVNVEAAYRAVGDVFGDKVGGVSADQANVSQGPSAYAIDGVTAVFIGPFDAEKVQLPLLSSLIDEERAFAGTYLDMHRPRMRKKIVKVYFSFEALRR